MTTSTNPVLPDIEALKARAHVLRAQASAEGAPISHSAALERVAREHGYRDWNALSARAPRPATRRGRRGPAALALGQRVEGRYLGQPFTGRLVALAERAAPGFRRVTIQFDAPVDVVRFDSFSALRRRVSGTIGPDSRSPERTSDGAPQLELGPLRP